MMLKYVIHDFCSPLYNSKDTVHSPLYKSKDTVHVTCRMMQILFVDNIFLVIKEHSRYKLVSLCSCPQLMNECTK